MHPSSIASTPAATIGGGPPDPCARHGSAAALAQALQASRQDTLAMFARCEQALPGLQVPRWPTLNPPLWELGHIGWFQAWWLGRNPQRGLGLAADPDVPRRPPARAGADALYDSSRVPHASRWQLPLPGAEATRADLAGQLHDTLALLQALPPDSCDDTALYFFRLALLHEDMHHEAGLYMARALGIAVDDPRWQAPRLPSPPAALALDAVPWVLGRAPEAEGFAFDNECGHQPVLLGAAEIDAQVLRWADYLPFAEAGGYADDRLWSAPGRAWRDAGVVRAPRYLRRQDGGWAAWRHGRWQPLCLDEPACHLSLHEAEAWCRWAGRRLPTEAEWEHAAQSHPGAFRWGDVWEWTASRFAPFPGFEPHPYRDYSAPWFDGRPVLRGGSYLTQPRIKHPRYRNFFPGDRHDVPAGLRSCAA